MSSATTILYRPVGPQELALIAATGFRAFPPRLPGQPLFYPVLNETYARQVAREWNAKASGAGYVTRFAVRTEFLAQYPPQKVGGTIHQELWIPAEHVDELNRNLVGRIEVIAEYQPETPAMREIHFYRVDEPYGGFSNFSPHPIKLKGRLWPTSEHYFQAQKFCGTAHEDAVRQAKSPMVAARMGRSRQRPLRADWETVKDDIMRAALLAKFTQHSELRLLLLETGHAWLVEHTSHDLYWADGGDGSGRNRLGHLLMELREQLRNKPITE